ncbi:unnamed protein product [Darwinula stevensoni]|uniref:RBR-type E3 ubiquitin transferase n=1 Tax=Darwinula stevensoni TaxID=69355 RepID=A0A7R8X745_9CRUS|nr:unnamed protein product [Darwinula stevensoni]CAG0886481.1 unnamed protein product [Darwinula stevensoni]
MPKIESVVRTPRGKEITKETKKKSKFKCFFKRKSAVGDSSQNQNVCKSKKQEALPTIEESCLILYASYEIRQGKVEVTCPDTGCEDGGSLFITELQELVPEEVWNLRERLKLFREIEEDPTRCWCPKPTCEGVCSSQDEVPLKVKQKITCPECQLNFCSKCLSDWHPNPDCQEAPPPHSFAIPADLKNVIKRCPFCNIFIERDAGCAQMFCKRCHHMFCWHCLTILDYDYLLRHYTSGPCKGKLGHSRISVLFYRIQFIGIVLGFGLVAILASPLLIVMAPCVCMYGAVCHNRK